MPRVAFTGTVDTESAAGRAQLVAVGRRMATEAAGATGGLRVLGPGASRRVVGDIVAGYGGGTAGRVAMANELGFGRGTKERRTFLRQIERLTTERGGQRRSLGARYQLQLSRLTRMDPRTRAQLEGRQPALPRGRLTIDFGGTLRVSREARGRPRSFNIEVSDPALLAQLLDRPDAWIPAAYFEVAPTERLGDLPAVDMAGDLALSFEFDA